ncbi:L,D-transpeptidase family protein [Actinocorallia sp. A-T 12471]|uniref:L,D-transpeptidase family protein n=1 Tax=Actinocorallia sp. A-T 12471 TaxID=3089813 RepID=UPI0029CE4FEF|nr:L,D-transpeptidase family protein [Actinocorallia sp. A-T 12471]MDX6738410.1 L,D-transpeptidase family protein [Actinocorallia sp. A-T 12471]
MRLGIGVVGSLTLVFALVPGGGAAAETGYRDGGRDVRILQKRLKELGFPPGKVNGRYGKATRSAVWAFQHANGIRPTARINAATRRALWHPRKLRPLAPGRGRRVEIDLRRQLLVVWKGRKPVLASHISTGANKSYCDHGLCGFARTPTGDHRVTRRIKGWHTGRLGAMYYPAFFVGGVALHGSTSVPNRPASHGCVRIPMHNAKAVYRMAPVGTRVYVRGAAKRR